MSIRAATDQVVGAAGVVVGSTVTLTNITQTVSLVGASLGLVLTALSIWLVFRRLRVARLETENLEYDRKHRKESDDGSS